MSDQADEQSTLESLRANLPDGTEEVMKYARDHPVLFSSIYEIVAKERSERGERRHSPDYENQLVSRYESLRNHAAFTAGDLVKWKPGLKNKRRPDYDEPAVVVEVLDDPIVSFTDEPGSAYFREPLDLLLGFLDDDEELVIVHFDSRRFQSAVASPST